MTIFPTCPTGPSGRAGQTRLTHSGPEAWGRWAVGSGGLWGHRDAGAPGQAPVLTLSASSGTRCCTRSSTYMLECDSALRRTGCRKGVGPSGPGAVDEEGRRAGGALVQMPANFPRRVCTGHASTLQGQPAGRVVPGQGTGQRLLQATAHTYLRSAGMLSTPLSAQEPSGAPEAMPPASSSSARPRPPLSPRPPEASGCGGPEPAAGSTPASGCAQGGGMAPTHPRPEHRKPRLGGPQKHQDSGSRERFPIPRALCELSPERGQKVSVAGALAGGQAAAGAGVQGGA